MSKLLLTIPMLEHVRSCLDCAIYYDPALVALVRGYLHHSGGCTLVLSHDDAEQVDYDLDVCSGIILMRLCSVRDGDDDWSDGEEDGDDDWSDDDDDNS